MNSRDWDIVEKAYSKWRFPLLRFLRRNMANETEAEDLVQESFMRWVSSGQVSRVERPHSFLFRIATHLLYDRSRHQAVRQRVMVSYDDVIVPHAQENVEDRALVDGSAHSPERQLASRETLLLLAQAIEELPTRQREVFVLHRIEGLTQEEVAQQLGISRQMVVKHLARAVAYCELRSEYAQVDAQ